MPQLLRLVDKAEKESTGTLQTLCPLLEPPPGPNPTLLGDTTQWPRNTGYRSWLHKRQVFTEFHQALRPPHI